MLDPQNEKQEPESRVASIKPWQEPEGKVYRPLESDHTRVLRLAPGWFNSPLRGRLEAYHVNSLPEYSAISHAWGEPVYPESLKLPGSSLGLTTSLHAALRRLRRRTRTIMVWADAVCINQKDDDEKSTQVPRMADVYRSAAQVVVWLGEATTSDLDAFWLVQLLADVYYSDTFQMDAYSYFLEKPDVVYPALQRLLMATPWHHLRSRPTPVAAFIAFGKLVQRPWFSRQWVFQEAALARACLLCCGKYSTIMHDTVAAVRLSYAFNVNYFDEHSILGSLHKTIKPGVWWHARNFLYDMIDGWRRNRLFSPKVQFIDAVMASADYLGTVAAPQVAYGVQRLAIGNHHNARR